MKKFAVSFLILVFAIMVIEIPFNVLTDSSGKKLTCGRIINCPCPKIQKQEKFCHMTQSSLESTGHHKETLSHEGMNKVEEAPASTETAPVSYVSQFFTIYEQDLFFDLPNIFSDLSFKFPFKNSISTEIQKPPQLFLF